MTNATRHIVHGYKPARMTAGARRAVLIRRPWRRSERLAVWHSFLGRLCIAVEPILCGTMFLALTVGTLVVRTDPAHPANHNMALLAPVFGLGVVACTVYAFALMLGPARALLHTFQPIFIVDGYVRFRAPDVESPVDSNGYAAVLTEERTIACEWPTIGDVPLRTMTSPALAEFSEHGGIHRIDGRSTGVLREGAVRSAGVITRRKIRP